MPDTRPPSAGGLRLFGHPLHPALSAFPIAFLSGSVLADGIGLWRSDPFWWAVSFWVVVAGVASAVPTALAGLFDYAAIPPGRPALKTAVIHLSVMLTAVGCFGVDLILRAGPAAPQGGLRVATLALDVAGAAIISVGGWLGGELVFAHGVGVAPQSHGEVGQPTGTVHEQTRTQNRSS